MERFSLVFLKCRPHGEVFKRKHHSLLANETKTRRESLYDLDRAPNYRYTNLCKRRVNLATLSHNLCFFWSLEIISRYRDPQLQLAENSSDLRNLRTNVWYIRAAKFETFANRDVYLIMPIPANTKHLLKNLHNICPTLYNCYAHVCVYWDVIFGYLNVQRGKCQ